MREHLLGYLLGALEPHEKVELEGNLAQNDQLRRELESLRLCLSPLATDAGHLEPPTGLATRTCSFIAASMPSPVSQAQPAAATRGWRAADLLVAACVLVAGALVLFPAINYSRFQSQVAGCQNNLRQIGNGFQQFASANDGFLPRLPTQGNEAVVGLHAAILREGNFVNSDSTFFCPGSEPSTKQRLPTRAELRHAVGAQLEALQRALGGQFGFTLGHLDGGDYQAARPDNRETFAVAADAPNPKLVSGQSANHRSQGQNVLFGDGHVKFHPNCQLCPKTRDDLYHNADGKVAPGKHADDSVIATSETPTLGWDK